MIHTIVYILTGVASACFGIAVVIEMCRCVADTRTAESRRLTAISNFLLVVGIVGALLAIGFQIAKGDRNQPLTATGVFFALFFTLSRVSLVLTTRVISVVPLARWKRVVIQWIFQGPVCLLAFNYGDSLSLEGFIPMHGVMISSYMLAVFAGIRLDGATLLDPSGDLGFQILGGATWLLVLVLLFTDSGRKLLRAQTEQEPQDQREVTMTADAGTTNGVA